MPAGGHVAHLRGVQQLATDRPSGEIVLETYGSHLPGDTPAIEVHQPGDVYPRDTFLYWGFPAESLRRLGRIVGSMTSRSSTSPRSTAIRGSSPLCGRRTDRAA